MLELRILLKGAILFFIVILISCSPVNTNLQNKSIKSYSTLYYITKNADEDDKKFFEKLIKHGSDIDRKNGYVLLGGYYYKIGKYNKSRELLEKYKVKDEFLEYARHLWLFDIYIKSKDKNKLDKIFVKTLKFKNKGGLSSIICSQYPVNQTGNGCLITIYNKTFSKKADINNNFSSKKVNSKEVIDVKKGTDKVENKTDLVGGENPNFAEKENSVNVFDDKVICVKTDDFNDNVIKGVLLNIKQNNLDIKTDFSDNCNGRWVINTESKKLGDLKYNDIIDFSLNYEEEYQEIYNYLSLNEIYNFYIISSKIDNVSSAEIITDDKNYIKQFFITYNEEIDNDTVSNFVYIGDYSDTFISVPLIKYYAKYPDKVNVIVGTDFLDKKVFDENFNEYFIKSIIVTPVCVVCNEVKKLFNKEFLDFYNMSPDFDSAVGYDIVTYIKNELDGLYLKNNYVSGIKGIKNDRVYREYNFYKIIGKNRLIRMLN